MWPGILVQKITTKQPTDDMIEIAIVAMEEAIRADGDRRSPRAASSSTRDPMPKPGETAAGVRAAQEQATPRSPRRRPRARPPCPPPSTRRSPADRPGTPRPTMADDHGLDAKLADLARQYDECRPPAGHARRSSPTPTSCARLGRELSRLEPVVAAYRELGDVREQLAGARHMRDAETGRGDEGDGPRGDRGRSRPARRSSSRTSRSRCSRATPTTTATSSWRSGRAPAARRRRCSRPSSCGCTPGTRRSTGSHTDLMSLNETGIGGIKEAILEVAGDGAYSRLKFEGGVHRVQRVPSTESSGRIHTSTATVIVLPEVDEVEVEIDEARDLRIDVKRASGPGGQSVNTTDSAVRITHLPDGAGGRDPGREEPAQEQGQGDGGPALPPVRPASSPKQREAQSAERQDDGPGGRPVREDPDLQLPRQPGHRPPHRRHDPQRARACSRASSTR